MLLKIAVLSVLVALATAVNIIQYPYHSTQERPEGTDKNAKGCYIGWPLFKVIPFDITMDKYYPDDGACEYYTCEEETWNGYRFDCDTIKEKKGCKIVKGDTSQKFPGCCDQLVCDNPDDNKQ